MKNPIAGLSNTMPTPEGRLFRWSWASGSPPELAVAGTDVSALLRSLKMDKKLIVAACLLSLIGSLHARLAQADDVRVEANAELLKPPAGQVLSFSARGDGVQIYQCLAQKPESERFTWTLKAPEAVLRNNSGTPSGRHYAGPTWEANDGSKVEGELVAKAEAPESDSIPWLLLRAKSTAGHGVFSEITFIQRLRTHNGNAPAGGCDPSQAESEVRVPYSALYRFYALRR